MVSITEWAAIFSAAAGVVAIVLVLLQIRHMDRHKDLETSMRLFEWAESDRLHKALRWVEEEFRFESYDKYKSHTSDPETSDYPYLVTGFFEQVGFVVERKFVQLDIIDDRLGPHIVANWKKLEPWIMAIRQEKSDETFGEHFQRLYEKTTAHLKSSR